MSESISNEMLANTAKWMAAVRGRESSREDRLFNDPWAIDLAGEEGAKWIVDRSSESVIPIVVRVRYFDEFLLRVTSDHQARQVVLVGAGLDTRCWRLHWMDGTRVYELDQPFVLKYKEEVMKSKEVKPRCERHPVGVYIQESWGKALESEGFQPDQPSIWLLEGFLFYLDPSQIDSVLKEVTKLASPGSWMGFDIINSEVLKSTYTKPWLEMQARLGAPWIGTMDDPIGLLGSMGWSAFITQGGHPGVNFNRWVLPVYPVDMPGMPHSWLVTAEKI